MGRLDVVAAVRSRKRVTVELNAPRGVGLVHCRQIARKDFSGRGISPNEFDVARKTLSVATVQHVII